MVPAMKPLLPALALALVLVLVLPAPAQESKPAIRVLKEPALVLKTTDSEVALAMLARLGLPDLLPKLEKDKHYVIKVFGPGKKQVGAGDGDVGFLEAMVTPGPLVTVFEEHFAEELGALEANVTFTLGQFGIPTKEIALAIKAVVGFPHQVARVDLRVAGNPLKTAKGVKIELTVTPAADTWFSGIVAGLEANEKGAPVLGVGGAPMQLRLAVKPGGLAALLEPVLELVACLGTRNRDEREAGRQMLRRILGSYDGSMAAAGDPFGNKVRKITGLRQADRVKEVMASEAFRKLTENQAAIVPTVEAEFEKQAFTHRDVAVSRFTMDMAGSGLKQVTTQYAAVAGSYLVACSGEREDGVKAMIDAVLDQKVKRAPLAKNALLTLSLDLGKMMDHLAGFGIPAPVAEGGPKLAEIGLFRSESALQLKINIE